jgi:Vitamin K-dependent gamma-carboxylase
VPNRLREFWQWAVESEGSTRPAALIRIGLAVIIWARFGSEVALFHEPSWPRVGLALVFPPAVTLMGLGCWTRWSTLATAAILSAIYGYAMWLGRTGVHHVYLLTAAVWLNALMPAGRSFSVDRWWALQRGRAEPERGNLWAQRLMALQVGILYFWAAFDKLEPGYATGERLEMVYLYVYGGAQYPYGVPWFHGVCRALAWATVAMEFVLAFGLFIPRWRSALMLAGVAFHGFIYLTLPVFTFSATILLMYVAFWDPDEVHRRIDRLVAP